MWKWIRVGIAGILIGLLGGVLYVEVGAVRKLYGVGQALEQMMDATDSTIYDAQETTEEADQMETAFQILDAASVNFDKSESGFKKLETYYDSMLAAISEAANEMEDDAVAHEAQVAEISDVIRLQVIYDGAEELSESEQQELTESVELAALYAIADKLGENYNKMEKNEVRKNLILSMEMINACASETAEEYGVDVTATSRFDYVSLPEAKAGDTVYPAGYYETLCITLGTK